MRGVRALIVLAVLASVRVAHAEPWSLQLGPEWSDITTETLQAPSIVAFQKQITGKGGTFEAKAFQNNETGLGLFIVTSDIPDIDSLVARQVFEHAAQNRGAQNQIELGYSEEHSAVLFRSTQRVKAGEVLGVTRRITGVLKTGRLRVISANCFGETPACLKMLDAIVVDEAPYKKLDSIPQKSGQMPRWLAAGVFAAVVVVMLVAAFVIMRRRRVG